MTIAVGHKGLLSVYPKRVAEFALATAILALSAAVCMAAKEAAARLEDGQVRSRQELSDVHSDRDAWRSEVGRLILV